MLSGWAGEYRLAAANRSQVRVRGTVARLAVALVAAALSACDRGPGSSNSVTDTQLAGELYVDLTTPENAARSTLLCLVAERRAIARGDKSAAQRCRQELRSLAAKEEITRRLRGNPLVSDLSDEQVLDQVAGNWGAVIGYYAEGLDLDRTQRVSAGETASAAFVLVPARGPHDAALIRVECVRGEENLWGVAAVGFQAERATSQPASAPVR
jgi:hypothetical protein